MKKSISKTEALEEINEFFKKVKNKTPEEVKKIKKLAMSHNIKMGDKRKLFCKRCLSPHGDSSITIKNDFINIICKNCGYKNRWKLSKEINLGLHYQDHESEECC